MKALIIDGSPEPSSSELVALLARDADYVVAVDRGAIVCRSAGVVPDLFCGDDDSADADTAAWARAHAGSTMRLPVEKDATDLAFALDRAAEEARRRGEVLDVCLTCATGGRPDHMLGALGLLLAIKETGPMLVEDGFELAILSPEGCDSWEFAEGEIGRTFSAVALEPGTVVSEEGMRWRLDGAELPLLGDRGVSNRIVGEHAKVTCHEGALAAFLIKD